MSEVRLLRENEIDVRVGVLNEKGATLLLYKNARTDMDILDEVYGKEGWKREHFMLGETIFCRISVRNEKGEWITREDAGTESFADPVKGACSDSFKRAGVNFGIGRELYSAPLIWIPAEELTIKNNNGKKVLKDKFTVSRIVYDNNNSISELEITNQLNKRTYLFHAKETDKKPDKPKGKQITPRQANQLLGELRRTGISLDAVLSKHNLSDIGDMDENLYKSAMATLKDRDTLNIA